VEWGAVGRQHSPSQIQARRKYQEFLLEDAKRFEAPMLDWAGELLTNSTFHLVSRHQMSSGNGWAATQQLCQSIGGMNHVDFFREGWKGPWIEDLWLEHWKQRWAAGEDTGDRIYIPVLWINCYFKCDKPRKQEMLRYLTTLKPEYSYMSVYMMVSQTTLDYCS
jgi:hypothetical protein